MQQEHEGASLLQKIELAIVQVKNVPHSKKAVE
jgi:hypothetical protein